MGDFEKVIAALPEKAESDEVGWYFNKYTYYMTAGRLLDALNGNSLITLANGQRVPSFLGYPVRYSSKLNKTDGASANVCVFGTLRDCVLLGNRRQMTLATLTERYADYDQLALKATQRFALAVHSVGDNTDAGGLILMQTHS